MPLLSITSETTSASPLKRELDLSEFLRFFRRCLKEASTNSKNISRSPSSLCFISNLTTAESTSGAGSKQLFGTSVRSCISNGYKVYIFLIENRCFSLRGTGPFSTRNRLNLVEKHVLSLNPNCKSKIKSILYILLFWLAFVVLL